MKKFLACIVSLTVLLSFSACGGGVSASKEYTPPEDVELLYCALGSYDFESSTIHALVYNGSSEAIRNMTLSFAQFDENGFLLPYADSHDYIELTYDNVNILSNEYADLDNYSANSSEKIVFADAAITKIEFANGETWESDKGDAWFESVKNGIDISENKSKIESLKDLANQATNNEYMDLISITPNLVRDDHISFDATVDIKDIGNKAVEEFEISALLYDEDGYPVNFEPSHQIGIVPNLMQFTQDGNRGRSGAHGTIKTYDYYLESLAPHVKNVKAIISEISFTNGDTWENPYTPFWEVYHADSLN